MASLPRALGVASLVVPTLWAGCWRSEPCVIWVSGACPADAGDRDASVRPCDRPTSVPDSIEGLDDFRTIASALVCDASLRCPMDGLGIARSYCHPGFAALDGPSPGFDLAAARACIRALEAARSCDQSIAAAAFCRDVSLGSVGAACEVEHDCAPPYACVDGRCRVAGLGDACTVACVPPLRCAGGVCVDGGDVGEPCVASDDCRADLTCEGGTCGFATACMATGLWFGPGWWQTQACGPGAACDTDACAPVAASGSCCVRDDDCDVGSCVAGICSRVGHVGCHCLGDAECPDVARCIDRVCTPRPMAGEPCDATRPCVGSLCDEGTCRPGRRGEDCEFFDLFRGPSSITCEAGLVCGRTCGPPIPDGGACAEAGVVLDGACEPGLYCTHDGSSARCLRPVGEGEDCSVRPCWAGTSCVEGVCVSPAGLGEVCGERPCEPGLLCRRSECIEP